MTPLLFPIIKRLFSSLIILFLVISFLFVLIRLAPGDPVQKYYSKNKSGELAEVVKKSYQLEEPVLVQYVSFLSNFITGDFGFSYDFRKPVSEVISNFAPFTIIFSLISFLLRFFVGFSLAAFSFKRASTLVDKLIKTVSYILYSSPTFIVGIILILIFAGWMKILPSSGLHSFAIDEYNLAEKLADYFNHLLLPLVTSVICGMPIYFLYIRENLENENQKEYITYLRSNGISEKRIFNHHLLPNSINPLLAVSGIELGYLLGGTLLIEVVFGLPGIGRLTIDAIFTRDYPLIIGTSFFAGLMMLISTFAADVARFIIDKRLAGGILN